MSYDPGALLVFVRHQGHNSRVLWKNCDPRTCWLLFLIVGCWPLWAAGPASPTERTLPPGSSFVCRTWRAEEGLPHNTVLTITQTRDGYLWIGTANGLARFDGAQFKHFGLADGLASLHVRVLLEDREGGLWIGTVNGLSRYQNGQFTTWTTRDGLAGNMILALEEDHEGAIWVATNTGLSRWRRGAFEAMGEGAGIGDRYIAALAADGDGVVWVSVSGLGLLCWNEGRFDTVTNFAAGVMHPARMLRDRRGRVWAGMLGLMLYREGDDWKGVETENSLPIVSITSLADGADGTMWVGTLDEGLFYLREGKFHRVGEEDGLSDTGILATFEDRERNVWVGTRAGGLSRLKARQVSVWRHIEGGAEIAPKSLAEAPDGSLWMASYGRGLYRIDPNEQEPFVRRYLPKLPKILTSGAIWCARDGSLWWGSGNRLAEWKDDKLITYYHAIPALSGDAITSLWEDFERGMWLGSRDGKLLWLKNGELTVFTNGLPGGLVSALVQQSDGTLWIGSYGGGLGRLKDGVGTTFGREQGLGNDLIRALCLDSTSNLWIGTEGGGLGCFNGGSFRTFSAAHGIAEDVVVQILEDDAGDLWLGTYRGILRLSRHELDGLLAGRVSRVYPRRFDRSDGLLSEQCVVGSGVCLKTRDGRLCFSTDRGLAVIDPKNVTDDSTSPTVRLEDLVMDGQSHLSNLSLLSDTHTVPAAALKIPPSRRRLELHYTALYFSAPERVRFRYRLTGLDPDWVEAGGRRTAYYSYVPPGRYHFEVVAHSGDGVWGESGAALALVVLPHFTQTWWFRIGIWLAGMSGVSVGIILTLRRRHRLRLEALERQHALDRERARIAQDLHDDLGASLTQVRFLGSLAGRPHTPIAEARKHIEQMRQAARDMVIALDEIVWAVNPKNDSLRALVAYFSHYATEFLRPTGIRCRLDAPNELPEHSVASDTRHHLFLAFKEALNNAVRHSGASEVQIEWVRKHDSLDIVVRDNGQGFDASAAVASLGDGLENVRRRLQAAGGQFELKTGPGQGTELRFCLPTR
jgi:signal transduction histidine kinase/ligand-binding sensor domain-containing protein